MQQPLSIDEMRARMEHRFGVPALQHPHPGIIGTPLSMPQALYSMIPTTQSFDHLRIPYDANQPVILSCEPILPIAESTANDNMDID